MKNNSFYQFVLASSFFIKIDFNRARNYVRNIFIHFYHLKINENFPCSKQKRFAVYFTKSNRSQRFFFKINLFSVTYPFGNRRTVSDLGTLVNRAVFASKLHLKLKAYNLGFLYLQSIKYRQTAGLMSHNECEPPSSC